MKLQRKGEFLSTRVQYIPLGRIRPNPQQPRRSFDEEGLAELAASIRSCGILQPLTVRRAGEGYELVAGERRLRAARIAGLREVPCLVAQVGEEDSALLALMENLQRRDLDCWEEAQAIARLISRYGLSQEEAARRLGRAQPTVANKLRLLRLPEPVRAAAQKYALTERHARALLPVKDEAQQLSIAQKVMALGLSVRQTEAMCKKLSKAVKTPEPKPVEVDYLAECEKTLTRCLGRGVKIVAGKRKGKIELEYYGQEDLQRLYEALTKTLGKEQP